jgi:hypothetical protein
MMYPRSHYRIPTMSLTAENAHTPTHGQLTEFSLMPEIIPEIANNPYGLIKEQISWTTRHVAHGILFFKFLLFSPRNESHVPRAHFQGHLRGGLFTRRSVSNWFSRAVAPEDHEVISSKICLMYPLKRYGLLARIPTWRWPSRIALLDHGLRFLTSRLIIMRLIEAPMPRYRKRRTFPHGHCDRQGHYIGHRGRHISRSYPCSTSFRLASRPSNAHAITRHTRTEKERNLNRVSREGRKREGVREGDRVKLLRQLFAYHACNLTLTWITAYTRAPTRILKMQLIALVVTRSILHWHYRSPLGYVLHYE